jgi:hypothetical protein
MDTEKDQKVGRSSLGSDNGGDGINPGELTFEQGLVLVNLTLAAQLTLPKILPEVWADIWVSRPVLSSCKTRVLFL